MRRARPAGPSVLLVAALAAAPAVAVAQVPQFDVERLRLDPSATGSLTQGVGELPEKGSWRFSYVIHEEARPLAYRQDGLLLGNGFGGSTDRTADYVSDRATLHVLASWTPARWLELHAELPIVGWQSGDSLSAVGYPDPKRTALAAPWLGFRVPIFRRSGPTGFSMALAVDGSGPILATPDSLAGPDGVVLRPRAEMGLRFESLVIGLEGGGIYRSTKVDVGPAELGHEVIGGLSIATTGMVRGELDLRGGYNLDNLGTYAEALVGIRFPLSVFESFLLGGPGFGDAPGTPRFRVLFGLAWPRPASMGVATFSSRPAPPPPPARTAAGATTAAPGAKPVPSPAPVPLPPPPKASRARLEGNRIELSEKIMFETGSARIAERSFGLLDDVVAVLEANPGVDVVIEGHTDSQGSASHNKELSHERAEAVRKFLVRRGIDARRLEAHGYGEARPIASNSTEEGREANRRVELRVKKK